MGNPGTARMHGETSQPDLRRLLARLSPDPVQAWQAYAHLRLALLTYFRNSRCSDAEQLADETLDRLAEKPDDYEITSVAEFAFGIARNVRREAIRAAALQSSTGQCDEIRNGEPSLEDAIVSQIDMEQKLSCLKRCMEALPPEERQLFQEYHRDESAGLDEHRQRLAEVRGLSWTAAHESIPNPPEAGEMRGDLLSATFQTGGRT